MSPMPKPGSEVFYHPKVIANDIPKLGNKAKGQIRQAIETKLIVHPEVYGLPLRGTLKKYWKLRVGPYRVVYEIREADVRVLVIAHRKDVYDLADKRG